MLYVREDIPAKLLSHDFPCAESFFVEINLCKKKWLINCSYNPHKNNIENHLDIISRSLDTHSTKYENIVHLGDFNVCIDDEALKTFCKSYSFNSLIKQPKFFEICNTVLNIHAPKRKSIYVGIINLSWLKRF